MPRDNANWLEDLRSSDSRQAGALGDLRAMIVRSLPLALSRRLPPDDPRLPALAEEVAQDTLMRVLARLDSFQGRSRFTNWVNAIAVHCRPLALGSRQPLLDFAARNIGPAPEADLLRSGRPKVRSCRMIGP